MSIPPLRKPVNLPSCGNIVLRRTAASSSSLVRLADGGSDGPGLLEPAEHVPGKIITPHSVSVVLVMICFSFDVLLCALVCVQSIHAHAAIIRKSRIIFNTSKSAY